MKILEDLNAISYSLDDYIHMFALQPAQLQMKILNCHAGIDFFAAQMHQQRKDVINIDPLYQYSLEQIKAYQEKAQTDLKQKLIEMPEHYEDAQQIAMRLNQQSAELFFTDFLIGKQQRYLAHDLSQLPFKDEAFDLALIKYFLFTYSMELSLDKHLQILQELLRVANEVRVFPLVTLEGELSPLVGEVIAQLQALNYGTEIKVSAMQLQKKGNALLRIWNPSCTLAAHHPT